MKITAKNTENTDRNIPTHPLTNVQRHEGLDVAGGVARNARDTQVGHMMGSLLLFIMVKSTPTAGRHR